MAYGYCPRLLIRLVSLLLFQSDAVVFRLILAVPMTVITIGLSWGLFQSPSWANECWDLGLGDLLESANTETVDGAIVLGQVPGRPYVVAVPGSDRATLAQIKVCIRDAFVTRSTAGEYIQAGAFNNRLEAESINHFLRSQGYDSRVIYLP